MDLMIERRRNRSENAQRALALFLDAQRERLGVHALTVANERGELIAGSGSDLRWVASDGRQVDQDVQESAWLLKMSSNRL